MTTELKQTGNGIISQPVIDPAIIESLVLNGDLSKMSSEQKVMYYNNFCKALGLNSLTQPFQIIKFQGKEKLYATKDCTEQLRRIYGVSVVEVTEQIEGDVYIVRTKVQDRTGRFDIDKGILSIKGLKEEALANAMMKCTTKSKRRATLSICGLGILDESDFDNLPVTYETTTLEGNIITQIEKQKLPDWMKDEISGFTNAEHLIKWAQDQKAWLKDTEFRALIKARQTEIQGTKSITTKTETL